MKREHLKTTEYDALRGSSRSLRRRRAAGGADPGTESLVHEAYLKLKGVGTESWNDRGHFLAVAALQLRHLLVDHVRSIQSRKRGGGSVRVSFDEEKVPAQDPT